MPMVLVRAAVWNTQVGSVRVIQSRRAAFFSENPPQCARSSFLGLVVLMSSRSFASSLRRWVSASWRGFIVRTLSGCVCWRKRCVVMGGVFVDNLSDGLELSTVLGLLVDVGMRMVRERAILWG